MSNFKVIDLKNGAKLYYAKNKISKTTNIRCQFNCGTHVETIPGLAHFTEHMLFAGTDELPGKQEVADKYFAFIGTNAITNISTIAFTGTIFTHELKEYLKLVSHLITHSTFNKKAVEEEIKVVTQEIASVKDDFKGKAYNFNCYNLFNDDVYKNDILGSSKTVASLKSKDVKDFVKKYFVTNNLDVFIVTPYSLSKAKNLVENELIDRLPKNDDFIRPDDNFLKIQNTDFFKIKKEKIKKTYIHINFPVNKTMYDREYIYKLSLVRDMMNEYSTGINKEIRLNRNLVYGSSIGLSTFKDSSIMTFATDCDTKNVNEVIKGVAKYIADTLKNGFSEKELDKAKRYFDFDDKNKEPRTSKLMTKLFVHKRLGFFENWKLAKKISLSTTLDECNAIFREIFTNPQVSMSLYGEIDKSQVMTKSEFKSLFTHTDEKND